MVGKASLEREAPPKKPMVKPGGGVGIGLVFLKGQVERFDFG